MSFDRYQIDLLRCKLSLMRSVGYHYHSDFTPWTRYAKKESTTLATLRSEIAGCRLCSFSLQCSPLLPSSYTKSPLILSILDYPSNSHLKREERYIELLIKYFRLPRYAFGFTYAIRCKPKVQTKIEHETIHACRPFCLLEISLVQPILVIGWGKIVHQMLYEHLSFNETVGVVSFYPKTSVLVTHALEDQNKHPDVLKKIKNDLQRASTLLGLAPLG